MSLTIEGKLKTILDVESGTSKAGKEWKKQSFVIDTGDEYNPDVCFSLFGDDKIALIADLKIGQDINVSFNLSSREFNGKFYHNIDAWSIRSSGDAKRPKEIHAEQMQEDQAKNPELSKAIDESDDLPF
jgi:hypothetical protein